ncbi:MAG: serine/threonine-protein phosphatase [Bacteroidales bacterium]|nr:serine/threonine-protein phosphatase [Bacteroidales bacterium]
MANKGLALLTFLLPLAMLFTACGTKSESEHVDAYEPLRSQITECDTTGFAKYISRIRKLKTSKSELAQLDADILAAWYFCQKQTKDSTLFYANRAIATLNNGILSPTEQRKQIADMQFVKGDAFYHAHLVDSCYKNLQLSLDAARDASYAHRIVKVYELIAKTARNVHDWQGTITQIRKAEIVLDTVPLSDIPPACRMKSLAECAGIAIDLCGVDVADRILTKASNLYDKASDRSKIAYLRQQVRLRFFLNQYAQASSAMNRIEMLVGKTGFSHLQADAMAFQGLARCRMGEREWAEQYCKKIKEKDLTPEGKLVFRVLRGELAAMRKDYQLAHKFLFDSIPQLSTLTPYDWALVNESRRTFWIVQDKYQEAYTVMSEERQRGIEMQNDVFAYNNRQREAEMFRIYNDRGATDDSRIGPALIILTLALIAIFITAAFFINTRCRERATVKKNEAETHDLQNELRRKVEELKQQAKCLERTNSRISDSISYAQHIQQSITPSPESLNDMPINGSFVFLSPLDVVSGDFFWFTLKGNKLIICCADCTGHGVPGAFLSMIAATIINGICDRLPEDKLDPANMLEMLDKSLVENLSHNRIDGEVTKDGLDASLAVLDVNTHLLEISAARRPVIIINGSNISTIRGTKRSIGDVDPKIRKRRFEKNTIQMAPGDLFYMYTDGYSDQFGGQFGEKLKNSRIEKFIGSIRNYSMDEQNLTTQEMFMQWKGDYPQTDDVLFIGIKV